MTIQFNEHGYLSPGEYELSMMEVHENFVASERFETSDRREYLFNNLSELLAEINQEGLTSGISHIWIDGSFCSGKLNPSDIDVMFFYKVGDPNKKAVENFLDFRKTRIKNDKDVHYLCMHDYSNMNESFTDDGKRRLNEMTLGRFEGYFSRSNTDDIEKGYVRMGNLIERGGEQND